MKKLLSLSALLVAAGFSGCAGSGVYVSHYGPPPAPRYGVVGVAPGPGYVWTEGYWDRHGNNWVWVTGSWRRPPHPHAVWVPGYWQDEHGHHRFHHGYWR